MNMSIRNIAIIALSFLFSFTAQGQTADKMPDKDQLAVALDYFGRGKYREALNILSRLDNK